VAIADPSFSFLRPPPLSSDEQLVISAELSRKDTMPWIRRRVLVSKDGHPFKGYAAEVINVLPRQPTPSGLRIEVQITSYNPSVPYPKVILDYDDLKDLKYVSHFTVPVSYSNGLMPGTRLSYTPPKLPPFTSQSIVSHLFSTIQWSNRPLRILTCTLPCSRLLAPHQCGPPTLPPTPRLPGTHLPPHLAGRRTQTC